jgi:hypothetical protein
MFGRFLLCNLLGVPHQPLTTYQNVARAWLGGEEPDSLTSEFVTWQEPERVEFEGSAWTRQVKDLKIISRRGIAKIGTYENLDVVAIMSGFAVVNDDLEHHLVEHLTQTVRVSANEMRHFHTDLGQVHSRYHIVNGNRTDANIRFVEGRRHSDNAIISITPATGAPTDYQSDLEVMSLGLTTEGIEATIFRDASIKVDAAGSPNVGDVPAALRRIYGLITPSIHSVQYGADLMEDQKNYEEAPNDTDSDVDLFAD